MTGTLLPGLEALRAIGAVSYGPKWFEESNEAEKESRTKEAFNELLRRLRSGDAVAEYVDSRFGLRKTIRADEWRLQEATFSLSQMKWPNMSSHDRHGEYVGSWAALYWSDLLIDLDARGAPKAETVAPPPHRPKGSGYTEVDRRLLIEMHQLLVEGKASSPSAAFMMAAGAGGERAYGNATFESKKARLVKSYRAVHGNGAKRS